MKAKTYVVKGIAMVPWETEIHVEAVSADEAKEKSRQVFAGKAKDCLVSNGQDEASACNYEPVNVTKKRVW